MQEIASKEYQDTATPEEISQKIDWLITTFFNPPAWLEIEDEAAIIGTQALNILEAMYSVRTCGLEPKSIAAYMLRRNGCSLRKIGRKLRMSHETVRQRCETVNQYSRDRLASISD